jgi:linoleoyl-CoA desaturase
LSNPTISFQKQPSDFYPVLRKRVDQYFKDNKLSKYANRKMIMLSIFILLVHASTYGLLLSNLFGPAVLLGLCVIHGFFTAQIGLSIGHDAIHGSYSANGKVNRRIALLFNFIGANDYVWSITHNVLHHTFTNIPDHDDDINQPPILRVSPNKKLMKIHRFQFIYAFLLYPFASLSWVLIKDYVKFFSPRLGEQNIKKHPRKEYLRLFGYKALYLIIFLAVPIMVVDVAWYWVLFGFFVAHMVEGITMALVFQPAHLVEGTAFPEPNQSGVIGNSWAEHQLYTTADFGRKNSLTNLMCGGLNFQIEHHLFPQICHVHYKNISPIVEQTAKEFGLPFIENKSFGSALLSHLRLLKYFGKNEALVEPREELVKANVALT